MMLYIWDAEPDLWSGGAEEDLKAWHAELAVWEAMTGGQGGHRPRQDDPAPVPPDRGQA